MSDAAKLRDNVHRLSRVHAATVETDDGPLLVRALPLILQLRQAITPTSCGSGSGSPTKHRLALDAGAFDTYRIIEEQARRNLEAIALKKAQPVELEAVVIRYQAEIQKYGDAEIADALHLTNQWMHLIENHLTPPKKRRDLQQPCPSCSALWDMSLGERRWAVTVWAGEDIPLPEWEAYCSVCEAAWVGEDLAYFLRATVAA